MSRTHTPGPWRIFDGVDRRVYLINGPDGAVAEIVFCETRRRADARLIAAAPELLAALRQWEEFMLANYKPADISWWNTTRDAIRKATAEPY